MKPILTTYKSLSIIPQLDLKHNLKQLEGWKLNQTRAFAEAYCTVCGEGGNEMERITAGTRSLPRELIKQGKE